MPASAEAVTSNYSGWLLGKTRGDKIEAAAIAASHSKAMSQANIRSVCLLEMSFRARKIVSARSLAEVFASVFSAAALKFS
jgi:hypothetical protein